ncbi:hypothetical protein QTN47_07830 [Danxiaibacter flavus]|uniref:Lipoprotein n=1 Tax=Danxiaibacter flavus TaxID=3049108 RepID=A0ABV3ZFX9_9BACT|nr:hypothetical protein QNM32_07830 [Chitinophagaceae bacterium DXS]
MKMTYLLVPLLFLLACNTKGKKETVNAEITERQMLDNGKLMLTYTYNYNSLKFIAKKEVENKPIHSDILRVSFSTKNPLKSNAELP